MRSGAGRAVRFWRGFRQGATLLALFIVPLFGFLAVDASRYAINPLEPYLVFGGMGLAGIFAAGLCGALSALKSPTEEEQVSED